VQITARKGPVAHSQRMWAAKHSAGLLRGRRLSRSTSPSPFRFTVRFEMDREMPRDFASSRRRILSDTAGTCRQALGGNWAETWPLVDGHQARGSMESTATRQEGVWSAPAVAAEQRQSERPAASPWPGPSAQTDRAQSLRGVPCYLKNRLECICGFPKPPAASSAGERCQGGGQREIERDCEPGGRDCYEC
jgi:hypothetical protein